MHENFATILETVAEQRADRTAVTRGAVSLTWQQLEERAARLAAFLADRGVGTDDRVAIALYNGPGYIETLFAALKLRAVPVNINYRYQAGEIAHVLADANAAAIVFDAALAPRVAAAAGAVPSLRTLVRAESPAAADHRIEHAAGAAAAPVFLTSTGSSSCALRSDNNLLLRRRWLSRRLGRDLNRHRLSSRYRALRRRRRTRFGRLRLRRLLVFQHASRRSRIAHGNNGQRERDNHEQGRRERGRFRKYRRRSARPESRLRAHAAKSSGQIRGLAALEQHHHDQKQTDNYIDNR